MKENKVKITKRSHAFKRYESSYNVEILNFLNPGLQLKDTESAIKNKLIDLLSELKGSELATTIVLEFKKIESDDKTQYSTFYLNSKAKANINESDIDNVFESIYSTVISNILKSVGKILG